MISQYKIWLLRNAGTLRLDSLTLLTQLANRDMLSSIWTHVDDVSDVFAGESL